MAIEEAFLQQILEDRDELYRETARLKSQLTGYENFASERESYQQQISEKDRIIDEKTQAIKKLQQQVEMLQRRIWGKSSERYISEDPQQRRLDFDGLDLLPESSKH